MSKIWIPTIGDRIKLLADWSFSATREYRNEDLAVAFDLDQQMWAQDKDGRWRNGDSLGTVTIPAETVLKIERVYIRGTFRDYDSVTFRIHQCPARRELTSRKFGGTGPVTVRFFAKLADVNNIEAEIFDGLA